MVFGWFARFLRGQRAFKSEMRELDVVLDAIRLLPVERACRDALRQIRDPDRFDASGATDDATADLPPDAKALFTEFEHITCVHCDLRIDRAYLLQERAPTEYICVGVDVDHTIVCVHENSGEAVSAELEESGWLISERWPSLWHYVLSVCALVYDYRPDAVEHVATPDRD